jgi:hypothetical protein
VPPDVHYGGLVKEPVKKDDRVVILPVATGYVPLATLEWANEVAKAARGVTSVATIEPPAHAPTCRIL